MWRGLEGRRGIGADAYTWGGSVGGQATLVSSSLVFAGFATSNEEERDKKKKKNKRKLVFPVARLYVLMADLSSYVDVVCSGASPFLPQLAFLFLLLTVFPMSRSS